ncbi:MAG: 3-hydroxyacyl-CoA dehydrogenase [Deltaproteobacteria bacterium]|nr:3-hydroxyacyl-CoA dehydrogenase [Deltaproteobacteria bacterium]
MPIDEIKKVCFLGAGTMGCFNSLVTAVAGYRAVLYDTSREALDQVKVRQGNFGAFMVERGFTSQEAIDEGLARIEVTPDPAGAADSADFLSESVPEILTIKREIHQQFDKLLPEHAIMTTNTSSLLVSQIEDAVTRGDRFGALHFHQGSLLVDVVGGPRTSAETVDTIKRFAKSIGMIPVVLKKEKDGYLHNTMLIAWYKSALTLAAHGFASIEDVDRSWMIVHQTNSGPFGSMDGVGLDVALNVLEAQAAQAADPEEFKVIADYIRPYVERGLLGTKTGQGFYTYPDPVWQDPGFLTAFED